MVIRVRPWQICVVGRLIFRHWGILGFLTLLLSACIDSNPIADKKVNSRPEKSVRFVQNNFICAEGSREHKAYWREIDSLNELLVRADDEFEQLLMAEEQEFSTEQKSHQGQLIHNLLMRLNDHELLFTGERSLSGPMVFSAQSISHYRDELSQLLMEVVELDSSPHSIDISVFRARWQEAASELKRLSQRLELHSCRLNSLEQRKRYDRRDFFSLVGEACDDVPWSESSLVEVESSQLAECSEKLTKRWGSSSREKTLKLCESLNQSKKRCVHQVDWMQMVGHHYDKIILSFLKIGQEKIVDNFFKLEQVDFGQHCRDSHKEEGRQLRLPIFLSREAVEMLNDKGLSKERFFRLVESYWRGDNISLRLVQESGAKLEVVFKQQTSSYFRFLSHKRGSAHIVLDKRLSGPRLVQIMAHELGHALGLPDCYVEFYDIENHQLVYYELGHNERNLMCVIGPDSRIPPSYYRQIEKTYCD